MVQVGAFGFPYMLAQAHGMVIISEVCMSVLAHDAATFIRDLVCFLNLFWKHNTLSKNIELYLDRGTQMSLAHLKSRLALIASDAAERRI